MEKENFKLKATNSAQYDSEELNWSDQNIDSPTRRFFAAYLEKNIGNLSGKKIIDIGSGTGYLSKIFIKLGANEIFGVEPSKNNVEISRKQSPEMIVSLGTLEEFDGKNGFDVAVASMVFEHIADPKSAFKKIFDILNPGGTFYLVTGDKLHFCTQRFGYGIESQNLNNNEVATKTIRPMGVMYDIFRPIENYVNYGKECGFEFENHVEMFPTEDLMRAEPKYEQFKNQPLTHLLVFKK